LRYTQLGPELLLVKAEFAANGAGINSFVGFHGRGLLLY
jgi:hypothetical protein